MTNPKIPEGYNHFAIGNIVRDKRDGKLFEILQVNGSSAIGRPLDPYDLQKNEQWAIILSNVEVVLDETTEAFDILYRDDSDPESP